VWTHKIQEKQADIYRRRYNCLETWRIILSAVTASGITATIFINEDLLKIIAAIISFVALGINSYFKVYNLSGLIDVHKHSALELLKLREKLISLLCDIKMNRVTQDEIIERRDIILDTLMCTYDNTNDASEKAVNKASDSLKNRQDNTFSDEEIDSFLPIYLRKSNQEG
jgi:hypothetical protein